MLRLRTINTGVKRLRNHNESLRKMAGLPANVLDEDEEQMGVGALLIWRLIARMKKMPLREKQKVPGNWKLKYFSRKRVLFP